MVGDKVDILLISETKIDDTFPASQFLMSGDSNVYRMDRNDKGGGTILFVRDNLCLELNLRKQKWLIFCCYNSNKYLIKDYLLQTKNAIDFCSKSYENIMLIVDFNAEISDSHMNSFCVIYHLKSLIKEPSCYKNPEKLTCIDLILTNSPRQFQATLTLETGLSDFHKMVLAAFKSESPHQKPKMISYRNYKHFDKNNFAKEIKNTLIIQTISPKDFFSF